MVYKPIRQEEEGQLLTNRWPHKYKKDKQEWFRHKPLISKPSSKYYI